MHKGGLKEGVMSDPEYALLQAAEEMPRPFVLPQLRERQKETVSDIIARRGALFGDLSSNQFFSELVRIARSHGDERRRVGQEITDIQTKEKRITYTELLPSPLEQHLKCLLARHKGRVRRSRDGNTLFIGAVEDNQEMAIPLPGRKLHGNEALAFMTDIFRQLRPLEAVEIPQRPARLEKLDDSATLSQDDRDILDRPDHPDYHGKLVRTVHVMLLEAAETGYKPVIYRIIERGSVKLGP